VYREQVPHLKPVSVSLCPGSKWNRSAVLVQCVQSAGGLQRHSSTELHHNSSMTGELDVHETNPRNARNDCRGWMARRPVPAADSTFLGRLASALSLVYPPFLRQTVTHQAPQVRSCAEAATRDFSSAVSQLTQLSADERRAHLISRADRDTKGSDVAGREEAEKLAAPCASTEEGGGAGESDVGIQHPAIQRPAYCSTDTAFKAAVNDSAVCSMLQLGELQRRLEHSKAVCVQCVGGAPAGVICTCRCVYGDLLCFACDGTRHAASPCARTRHCLLRRLAAARPVLVALHANEWVSVPASIGATGVVGDIAWIRRRGKSGARLCQLCTHKLTAIRVCFLQRFLLR
jgi:hypothetical protein